MYYTQSQWLLFFFTYCFLGWIWETCYVSFMNKEWINRGFLRGPVIPIYGFGAIIILWLTFPFKENIYLIYILGLIGATILEYLTGTVMEQIFKIRYWDYSRKKFNLNGYISLFTSLAWGFFSILLVMLLHPSIEKVVFQIQYYVAELISLLLMIVFVVDVTKSVQSALDMKKLLSQLTENNEFLSTLELKLNDVASNITQASDDFRKHFNGIEKNIQERISIYQHKIEKRKKSNKAFILKEIQKQKYRKANLLEQLNKKADIIIKEIQLKINSYTSELEKLQLSKILKNLNDLKNRLREAELNKASLKNKGYQQAANIIHRNPYAVSMHFKDAFNEIKSLNKSKKKK